MGALICPQTLLKVPNHFINVQDGCEKDPKVVYSLNHDIMAIYTGQLTQKNKSKYLT